MDASDIRYILALTRLEATRRELQRIADLHSLMILRLSSQLLWMKTLATDLQIPESGLYSSRLTEVRESLCRGREVIEKWLNDSSVVDT
jgi:hypothetical protein